MAITAETRTDIIELVVAAYNQAPGTTLLTELVTIIDTGGTLADVATALTTSDTWTALYPSFQTAEEFATEWLTTLVPEASADALAGGIDIAVGLINAGASHADVLIEAQAFLSNVEESDADFGTSGANFNNKVEVATHHTVTLETAAAGENILSSVTSDDDSVTAVKADLDYVAPAPGETFTLTTDEDAIVGTAADSVITASTGTFGTGDTIAAGEGTDTLNVTLAGAGPTQSATSMTGVEILNITASPNPATLNLTGVTGITEVNNASSANGATLAVSNLGNAVDTTITGTNTSTTIGYTTAVTAATAVTDSSKLTLAGTQLGSSFVTSGIETLTVDSTTSKNVLSALSATGVTSVKVTGDQDLTVSGTVGGKTLTTLDASDATGAITMATGSGTSSSADKTGITVTAPTSADAGLFTVTTGSNKDVVTLGGGDAVVATGAGVDTITATAGANTITPGTGNDSVTMGSGVDTVRFAEAGATNADNLVGFGADDIIALNLGAAAVSGVSNATANATFGTVQTGGTSPVMSNVNGTGTGSAISFQAISPNATATVGTVAGTSNVLSLNGAYTDGTAVGVITALGTSATTGITTTTTGKFLLATYSVGDIAQVWAYSGDSTTADTNIEAAELSLVATLSGVTQSSLTADNFSTYLTGATAAQTVSNTGQTIELTGTLNTVQSTANAAGQFLTSANDTITVGTGTLPTAAATATSGLTVIDPSSSDADVLNATVLGDWAAGSVVSGIETLNLNMLVTGTTFNASAKTPGTTTFNATGSQDLLITGALSGTAFGLGAGYTGDMNVTPIANPTAAYTLNLNGTAGTSAGTSPSFTVNGGSVITALTIKANADTTVAMSTNTTEFATGTLSGSGDVTIFDTGANFAAANITASAPTYTGTLTFRPSAEENASDYSATGVVTGLDVIDFTDIAADGVAGGTYTLPAVVGGDSLTIVDSPATARDSAIQNITIVQLGSSLNDSVTFNFGAKTTPALTGAITAATTETVTINYSGTTAGTAFSVANVTTANALGTQTVDVNGTGAFTLGTVTADELNTAGVGATGSVSATLANGTAGAIFTGGAGAATIIGSTAADRFTGGAGIDSFRNTATGAAATAGDSLTGGAGNDTYILSGDAASGAVAATYAVAPNITDFSISGADGVDILSLSTAVANYTNASAFNSGDSAAQAAGATTIATLANGGTLAAAATTDFLKLTTAVDSTGLTIQTAFNAAIGGGAGLTGLVAAADDIYVSYYDSATSKMVVLIADAGGGNQAIATADVVSLVGTIDMTATEYAAFGTANLAFVAA